MTMKKPAKQIDGILLLDKATGITSNRALQQVKHFLGAAKAGHTGSLDPLASGLLPICFGKATKLAGLLLDADKTYLVEAKLGITTTTGDCEGDEVCTKPVPNFSREEILQHIATFKGQTLQVPSMYSALKHNGQPLYKLARKNITVERPARPITVFEYELLDFKGDWLSCRIKCSKGTYVRTLIEDLGNRLGCGAHVTALRRIAAGRFTIEQTTDFATLQTIDLAQNLLLPLSALDEPMRYYVGTRK